MIPTYSTFRVFDAAGKLDYEFATYSRSDHLMAISRLQHRRFTFVLTSAG